jgi:gluconolactonase
MSIEIRDPRFVEVVGSEVAFEKIAGSFGFTEGPLWHPQQGFLLFTDIPETTIYRWSAADGLSVWRKPSNMANGLTYDREGRLLACEHASSHVTRTGSDGRIEIVASHYDGKLLNSPNDIVVSRGGVVYFSDPTYGRTEPHGVARPQDLSFQGAYCFAPGGALRLIAGDFVQPNGLCLSLDERRLFVNDTIRQHIRVFDVQADGMATGGRVWAETTGTGDGAPDGMKLDSAGHLYCCGPGGIHVFDGQARCLGVIRTPEYTANFCFGDADFRSLYIAASTSIYRIRVKVPGLPVF